MDISTSRLRAFPLLLSLSLFLLLLISPSPSLSATLIFDNSTQSCGSTATPCLFSSPTTWVEGKAPVYGDDVIVYADGDFFIEVTEKVEINTLYFKSAGGLIVNPQGELIVDGAMTGGDVGILISSNVDNRGKIIVYKSLEFQGVFESSGSASVEIGGVWRDITNDTMPERASSVINKDAARTNAEVVVFSAMTNTTLYNSSEFWIQETGSYMHDVRCYDSTFLMVVYTPPETDRDNLTLTGNVLFADNSWFTSDIVIADGNIVFASKAQFNDLSYKVGATIDMEAGTLVIEALYPFDNEIVGEHTRMGFNIRNSHVDIKSSPSGVSNYIDFWLWDAEFSIQNANLTHAYIRAVNSTLSEFNNVQLPSIFEMDEETTLNGNGLVFSQSFSSKARLHILDVTIRGESIVEFGTCTWDNEVELYIDDSALACDTLVDTQSQFMILHMSNGGLLNIPTADYAFVKQLIISNSSRIVGNVDAIDVNIVMATNSDKFTFEGNLTVREHVDVLYFTPMNSLISVTGNLKLHDVVVSLNASQVQLKEGKEAKYVLFVAKSVEVDALSAEVSGRGKNIDYVIKHTDKEIYIEFSRLYETDKRQKKVLLWVFVTGICLSAVALVLSVLVVKLQKRQQYQPVLF